MFLAGEGYYYPPPPVHDKPVLAVVVEKKGDETRTSMRQSEIYAFSPHFIMRDGYMVMPRDTWKAYEPGEWFMCSRSFSTNIHGETNKERDLFNLKKIDQNCLSQFGIPPTKVVYGAVRIDVPFVVGPEFIRRQNYRAFKKLYLLGMGPGFMRNREFNLSPGRVYRGIFEFRAKDNGGVCFDPTNVLERNAMWELLDLIHLGDKQSVPIAEHPGMSQALIKLRSDCEAYYENVKNVKEQPLLPVGQPVQKARILQPARPRTLEDIRLHQKKTIVETWELDKTTGNRTLAWKDMETNETAGNQDILNFKFETRYGIPPQSPEVSAPPIEFPDQTINDLPIASSTPRPSPNTTLSSTASISPVARRRHVFAPDMSMEADSLAHLRFDNNANNIK